MNIDNIKSFIILAETLNFTKAASKENITQTAMSRRINSIEEELEVLLFYRNNKEVKLTLAGKEFYQKSKSIISLYDLAITNTKNLEKGIGKYISIGVGTYEHFLLDKYLKNFTKEFTDVKIKVFQYEYKELLKKLNSYELDLILTTDQFFNQIDDNNYDKYLISKDPWLLGVNKESNLANEKIIDTEKLNDKNFVTMFTSSIYSIYDFYKRFFEIKDITYVNTYFTKLCLINSDLGIGFFPNYVKTTGSDVILKPTNPPVYLRKTFVLKRKNNNNFYVKEFFNLIKYETNKLK